MRDCRRQFLHDCDDLEERAKRIAELQRYYEIMTAGLEERTSSDDCLTNTASTEESPEDALQQE